jgi:ATP-dependent exoDNAse (exonuclease V) beta subunit
MSETLTVYKASAGSGKTFTLAVEYIKLLIRNPYSYRSILAVTFTNKATEEMKMRIISQLYGLWKGLYDSNDYLKKICDDENISESIVRRNSGIALISLLHYYNYFHIETIDSFFQSVLRNLAHELELTANLRVDLNDMQVKDEAVDSIFMKLDEDQKSLKWILGYINDRISDDNNWNIIKDIKKFGKKMFDDRYKSFSMQEDNIYGNDQKFDTIYKNLRELSAKLKNHILVICDSIDKAISEAGIPLESVNVTIKRYLANLRDDNLNKPTTAKDITITKWAQKKSIPYYDELNFLADTFLSQKIDEIENIRYKYISASLTLKHLNEMRLLKHVENEVNEINRNANRFLLSNTPQLLNSLIMNSDAPFIFEKIGSHLDHIMIDEFQDTSISQWNNFKKLLLECMSHADQKNLIVGDVKQSIYRWRSGDWRLLNNIETEFHKDQMNIVSLKTNYRSSSRIIDFNNMFFLNAIDIEINNLQNDGIINCDMLRKAYSDVKQEKPEKMETSGHVTVKIYQGKTDVIEEQLDDIVDSVRLMLDHHIPQSEIAILVRSNRNIQTIADKFSTEIPEIKIISNDAFRLDSSESVNMIVNAIYLLTNPKDKLCKAYLVKNYQKIVKHNNLSESQLLCSDKELDEFLPPQFIIDHTKLLSMSLYELAEKLYEIFDLSELKNQNAYVCALYDYMIDFINNYSSDIDQFIEEWKDNLCGKTIQSNDINGIHVFTIHKSKGLEFNNVIIPFCDWKMEIPGDTIWCEPNGTDFDELRLIPINYSNILKNTCYCKDYQEEHFQNIVDNINLLYVGFTRAKNNLFVFCSKSGRGKLINDCIKSVSENLFGSSYIKGDEGTPSIFTYGDISDNKITGKVITDNVFLQPSKTKKIDIQIYTPHVVYKQSNKSREFIGGNEYNDKQQQYINDGIVLHKLLSEVASASDLPNALRQLEQDGIIGGNIKVDRIRKMFNKYFETSQINNWFSGHWKLFNECNIISTNLKGVEQRPDRVMVDEDNNVIVVDFKFGRAKEDYPDQVKRYMKLLTLMGYHNIKGYLWYVYSNKIEEVK